jgi:KaiC/GvpD/RAD55 family RecA-like ATPase
MAENPELTSTGIPDIDRMLDGGFTQGFTTLLLAPVGAGAEIFAKQFAASHGDEIGTFFTTAESEKDVKRAIEEASWPYGGLDIVDIQGRFAAQSLLDQASGRMPIMRHRMMPAASVDPEDLLAEDTNTDLLYKMPTKEEYGQTDYLSMLLAEYKRRPAPQRIVINNLDFFFNLYPPEQVIHTLNIMRTLNAQTKGQLLWVLSKGVVEDNIVNRMALLSDCFLEMETERKANEFQRYLVRHNVRNRPEMAGASAYTVNRNGISVQNVQSIA